MAEGIVIATGVDGKPSIWPARAFKRDNRGVFYDFHNRIVPPPTVGIGMDSAVAPQTAKRKLIVGKDTSVEDELIRLLLPTLKRLCNEAESEAEDGVEEEQKAMFDNADNGEGERFNEATESYKQQRQHWFGINAANLRNRGRAYASVAANAYKGH